MGSVGVEAKPSRVEVAEVTKRGLVMDANGCLREWKELFPKAPQEVARPDLRELRYPS